MNYHCLYIVIVLVCWSSSLWAKEPLPVSYGQQASKQIKNGEAHQYRVTLEKYATLIEIAPSYFNVAVTIRDLTGEQILRVNSPPFQVTDEYLLIETDTAADYIIEIEAVSEEFVSGDYRMTISKPEFSPDQLAAAMLSTEASQVDFSAVGVDRRVKLKKALELYGKSSAAWQKAGSTVRQRRALAYKGWLALELGELEIANSSFTEALALDHPFGIQTLWIQANLGFVQWDQDRLDLAEKSFQTALLLSRQVGDDRGTGSFLSLLGTISQNKNLPVLAASWYAQALTVFDSIDYPLRKAQLLNNIGGTQYQMGNFELALEYYQRALEIHQQADNLHEQATVLGNMASLYRDQGDLSQSLEFNLKSLEIDNARGNIQRINHAYHRLGILFQRMGDYRRSEAYHLRAYEGRRQSGSLRRAASSLRNLGALYSEQGEIEKALEALSKALSLYKQISSRVDVARTQVDLASNLIRQHQLVKVKPFLDHASSVFREAKLMPDLADALMQLGHYHSISGDIDAAKAHYTDALDIQKAVPDPIGEIDALVALADLEKRPQDALVKLAVAEAIAHRIHQGVANPALKARFSATLQTLYNSIIVANLDLHEANPNGAHAEIAFMASERNRARSLLQLVTSSDVAVSAEQSRQIEKQKLLRRKLNALWFSTSKLRPRSTNSEIVSLVASNDAAITDVMTQLDNLTSQFTKAGALNKGSDEFKVADIQSALAADELLLHMHLGDNEGAIWSVSNTTVSLKVLPPRESVEKIARAAYNSMQRDEFSQADGEKFARLTDILIEDVTILAHKRRVYVVADGFLQYIPFAALVNESDDFLIDSTAFVSLPSSRSLLQKGETAQFGKNTDVVVYADPVFGETDFRTQLTDNTILSANNLTRAVTSLGLERVSRLPFSSMEADEIVSSVPSATIISGFGANKQDIFDRNLQDTEILHFATHGVVNDKYPDLSGLILSLIDKDKIKQDGFLSVSEIATLRMNPRLVVLSACETGIGEAIAGEGLLSLARAFLSQGADHVVSSLWQVNDRATAELMGHFYRAMFEQQIPIDQALRYAQQKIANQPRWSAPYYWAGFVTSSTSPLIPSTGSSKQR